LSATVVGEDHADGGALMGFEEGIAQGGCGCWVGRTLPKAVVLDRGTSQGSHGGQGAGQRGC